jgi:hypothetical protein
MKLEGQSPAAPTIYGKKDDAKTPAEKKKAAKKKATFSYIKKNTSTSRQAGSRHDKRQR